MRSVLKAPGRFMQARGLSVHTRGLSVRARDRSAHPPCLQAASPKLSYRQS